MNNIYFMCENCGIETNGITFVNGMKFCAKCYHQIFGKDNQQTEITQLKQQLAEKDKEIAHLKEMDNYHLLYELAGADETIANLKKQLAEKDIRIEELEGQFAYECECNKQLVELQKQLAEKDKEIEDMDKDLVFNANEIKRLIQEKKQLKQNQKELAIQELEKVKEEMDLNGNSYCEIRQGTSPHNPTDYAWFNYVKFRNYLNQQIKELKGEK